MPKGRAKVKKILFFVEKKVFFYDLYSFSLFFFADIIYNITYCLQLFALFALFCAVCNILQFLIYTKIKAHIICE